MAKKTTRKKSSSKKATRRKARRTTARKTTRRREAHGKTPAERRRYAMYLRAKKRLIKSFYR